jgi:hypothetical protein
VPATLFRLSVNRPTRVFNNRTGAKSSTRIDHIFTNAAEICSKAVSTPIGCSDHNIIAKSRRKKKTGHKIVYKQSYNRFCIDSYVENVKNICWSEMCNEEHPDTVLEAFMKLHLALTDRHIKNLTVKTAKSPWIDDELKKLYG